MISFRYHLVSIVAVFFALALGVLMGTTLLNQGVVDELERRTDAAVARAGNLRDELDRLEVQLADLQTFPDELESLILDGQLADREVVLMTGEGVDLGELDDVRSALEVSGAAVEGVLVARARLALPDDETLADLAALLATDGEDPEALTEEAGRAIGDRLADGGDGSDGDLLGQLAAAGFLEVRGASDLSAVGGDGQSVVVLMGGDEPPLVDPRLFFLPLLVEMASEDHPALAGETADTVYPFVPLVRAEDSLDGELVTVDNADSLPGRLAVVLGLRELLETGRGGDYGVKDGTSGLFPRP